MQVKKKAAKKTYKSSAKKKTVPSLKKMSVEELLAVMTENHAKTEAAIERLSADLAESHVRMEARMEARHAKTEAAIQELSAENRKTAALVHQLTQNMGGLNNPPGPKFAAEAGQILDRYIVLGKLLKRYRYRLHC